MEVLFLNKVVDNYTKTEYLTGFYTIIFTFVMVTLFRALSDLVLYRRGIKFDLVLFSWLMLEFFYLLVLLYNYWENTPSFDDGILYFVGGTIHVFSFIIAFPLFLPAFRYDRDMKAYYENNKKSIFRFIVIYIVIFELVRFFIFDVHRDLNLIFNLLGLALAIMALIMRSRFLEIFILIYMYFVTIAWFTVSS